MPNNLPPNYQPIVFNEQIFSCRLAATSDLPANLVPDNYINGLGTQLINSSTLATLTIDGVTPSVGDRVLITSQTAAEQNGVYVVTVLGNASTLWVLTRAPDWCCVEQFQPGQYVTIEDGVALKGNVYVFVRPIPNRINFDAITFVAVAASSGGGVNPGLINQIAYYATAGSILSGTSNMPGLIQLQVSNFNTGTGSSATTFWRGDGTWATPPNGLTWSEVSGTAQAALVNNAYIANNVGLVTVTLPATAAIGSLVAVQGKGAGLWRLAANTGQVINVGNTPTTTAGSVTATNRWDAIEVVCVTANTTWAVRPAGGAFVIV